MLLFYMWNEMLWWRFELSVHARQPLKMQLRRFFTFFCMHALKMIDNKLISAKGFMMLSFC